MKDLLSCWVRAAPTVFFEYMESLKGFALWLLLKKILKLHCTSRYNFATPILIVLGTYDCAVHIWNRKSGEKIFSTIEHSEPIKAVSWLQKDEGNVDT